MEDALDKVQYDDNRSELWARIVAAINLVCDEPNSADARRFALNLPELKTTIWRVPIRVHAENQDWCLMWAPDGDDAVISYVGPWPPA